MSQMLRCNQTVTGITSNTTYVIERLLGDGTQGEVYLARCDGKALALKWYFPEWGTNEHWDRLEQVVRHGAPCKEFLWPIELARSEASDSFGYSMPLLDSTHKSLNALMLRQTEPTFRALATAGLQLVNGFFQLHAKGLCYRDISFNNLFFDPHSGDVSIGDNDNVTVDGDRLATLAGTPRFMAPEIVRREAKPSTQTDLYSLAVLLFYVFMIHHPLEGSREHAIHALDATAMNKLYGELPLFIFDPSDSSNRPVPGFHDNALTFWPIYPEFLRRLFLRSFTDGLRDPLNGRVRETEWRAALAQLRDWIVICGCGAENFYDRERVPVSQQEAPQCWSCQKTVVVPPRIKIGRDRLVVLNARTDLYPHHVDDKRMYDFSKPIATVVQHPAQQGIWGLKNLSEEKWACTVSGGGMREVEPGRSVTIATGTKVNFGGMEGEFRA